MDTVYDNLVSCMGMLVYMLEISNKAGLVLELMGITFKF